MLYLPAEEVFQQRNELLKQLQPKLKRSGFTDYFERGDPDPSCPIWKNIRLEEFQREPGFDLDSFVGAIVDAFRQLMEIEPLIEYAFGSRTETQPPIPSERRLKTIAFLDTEWEGMGTARKMTELAIVDVAYDADADAVVGILEEYRMNAGQPLDETKPLLAQNLPGTEKMKWLCSFRGIEWKQLGIQSESLETLMGKAGLRYTEDHKAGADARDLKRLLALKHKGRTYLGRLLDSAEAES